MGKVAAAEMKRKKKGRPSFSDIQKRNLQQQKTPIPNRSKPNLNGTSPAPDSISGDDEDDERHQKKVKLVVRLPPSNHHLNSASNGSDSNADADKSKIDAAGDGSDDLADQVEMDRKATDTLQGSRLESGPTTPLPDKKLLVFILDRLQKKDTHGAFSEPVDPNELPDYHEIIEHPMDFGTVRNKLDKGRYSNLDEFETDVFLICSNAMQYNAPDTIYFRQARSIQEVAKRDFENLKQVNANGEPQPRIVRRGRPPGKNLKKPLGCPPFDRVSPESFSDATLATVGDTTNGSNSYNLRRGPMPSFRFHSNDPFFRASHHSRNNETYADSSEWNSEFPASILKAEAKYGKKQFSLLDENRRATYKHFDPSAFHHEPSLLTTLNCDVKQLTGVGLHFEHSYARSLARFAAHLGPVVWKIASNKIQRALPAGVVEFGPGWVGENEASPQPPSSLHEQKSSNNSVHDGHSLGLKSPYTSGINCAETGSGQNSNSELAVLRSDISEIDPGPSVQIWQKHILHSDRNSFVSGYDLSSRMASNHLISESKLAGSSSTYENISAPATTPDSHIAPEATFSGVQSWQGSPLQHRQFPLPVPPDLNIRFQAPGSPSSSSCIGSTQNPDLALQL
ncbi:Bromodomain-containing protein [Actinidia chinensis var. chinensis]|uniref:Bromodomain-containing protein n=1 Tax=Actinidia chinensis var. chinensis TaxID=1590841 RepID=A0A2R6PZB6_ACTCC|nr:Bromodomain-containing protein [Actinidia chinensis var. chinensis]